MDLHAVGGLPLVMKMLLDAGLIHGDCMTVTGQRRCSASCDGICSSTSTTALQPQAPLTQPGPCRRQNGQGEPCGRARVSKRPGCRVQPGPPHCARRPAHYGAQGTLNFSTASLHHLLAVWCARPHSSQVAIACFFRATSVPAAPLSSSAARASANSRPRPAALTLSRKRWHPS